MKFINSQYITSDLTHLTPKEGYQEMKKTGIKVIDRGDNALLYKPPGFFISINGDWERWCTSEEFRNVKKEIICNVYLKPNLTFIRISTRYDADELMSFLIPELKSIKLGLDYNYSSLSDFLILSRYQLNKLKTGEIVTMKKV